MSDRISLSKSDFIALWNKSDSIAEITQLTGLKNSSLSVRASHYRTEGIELKYYIVGVRPNTEKELLK